MMTTNLNNGGFPGRRRMAGWLMLTLAVLAIFTGMVPRAVAQERWLLVFDTSLMMKKRMPAMDAVLKDVFVSNMGGNMHAGDSFGVWTFDNRLHSGEFPLLNWDPSQAMIVQTNLMKFLNKKDFKGETDFDALEPVLDRVIQNSQRLTVLIFCDGDGQVNWTPYNDGINENLQQGMEERKKHHLPVIMVVRTQQGKFVGVTVSYPPLHPTIPPFPPLPSPVKIAPVVVPPPPPPPVELPPLVVVGKSVGTDVTATVRYEETNRPAHAVVVQTNKVPEVTAPSSPPPGAEATPPEVTGTIVASTAENPPANTSFGAGETSTTVPAANVTVKTTATPPTNVAGTTVVIEETDSGTRILLVLGAILLGLAISLVIWLATRRRGPPTSLITSLMSDDPKYRK